MNHPSSFSQLSLYADCAKQYRYRYVDRLPGDDSSVPTEVGSAVHQAIEEYETRLVTATKAGLDTADLPTLLTLARHHLLAIAGVEDMRFFGRQDLKWWFDEGVERKVNAYIERRADELERGWTWYREAPLSVELSGLATFGGDQFRWIADQVLLDPGHNVVIRDIKTGKPKDHHKLQLNLYMLGLQQQDPSIAEAEIYGQLLYLVGEPKTSFKAEIVPLTVTEDQADGLVADLQAAKRADVFPATGIFTGACKFCPYRSECPVGSITEDAVDGIF